MAIRFLAARHKPSGFVFTMQLNVVDTERGRPAKAGGFKESWLRLIS